MNAKKPKAISILGMHRSGTSAVARAINLLGPYLGPQERLIPPKEGNNPDGFWEHIEIVAFHERLFKALSRTWDNILPTPENWWKQPAIEPYRRELTDFVRREFGGQSVWLWKDPRSSLLLPLWQEVLRELDIDVFYVLCLRNPLDVAESLKRRDGFSRNKSLNLWLLYTASACYWTNGTKRIVIGYDHLLEDWEKALRKVSDVFELPWPEDDQALRTAMADFIKLSSRHSSSNFESLTNDKDVPEPVVLLYRLLLESEKDQKLLNEKGFSEKVSELYLNYLTFTRMISQEEVVKNLISSHHTQISQLESNLREREVHIKALEQEISDRDVRIGSLNRQLEEAIGKAAQEVAHSRDAISHAKALEQEIADRDNRIADLNRQLEEAVGKAAQEVAHSREAISHAKLLEQEIADRDNKIKSLNNQLTEVKRSLAWKLIGYERSLICRFFPMGTERRKMFDLCAGGLRILINDGPGPFFSVFRKKLRRLKGKIDTLVLETNALACNNQIPLSLEKGLIGRFVFPVNGLNEIRILTATYKRQNSAIILNVMPSPEGPAIRSVKVNGNDIRDNGYTSFEFRPIKNSAGEAFFFSLRSTGQPSAAVWYAPEMPSPVNLLRENVNLSGCINFQAFSVVKKENLYDNWIIKNEPARDQIEQYRRECASFKYRPKISIITPVWNTEKRWLEKAIESVLSQVYDNWELCIADGGSTHPDVRQVLSKYAAKNSRIKIKFSPQNKGIAGNSNEAAILATGEYVVILDHDDEIAPFALYEVVKTINEQPDADFIYSDRDKISASGKRFEPFFKPDWSPDYLLSQNYLCHINVIRKKLFDEVGQFRKGYDGSQDYDLVLRVTEKTTRIVHIPKILYHWRAIHSSAATGYDVKPYAIESALKALQDAVDRRGCKATVTQGVVRGLYRVHFHLDHHPKVSIVIPTKDRSEVLRKCVESILRKTTYTNYEIVIVDNNSFKEETLKYYKELSSFSGIKLLEFKEPFNFSKINNYAVSETDGEYLLFLNNDTEVITDDWLDLMVGFARRRETGAVGAKLIYPNETIQHAGLILDEKGNVRRSHHGFHRNSLGYAGRIQAIQNVSAVAAACMMVRREVFEEIGGFDPRYVVAHGDIDFCLRLITRGYLIVYEPHAELYHHESFTRGYEDTPEKIGRLKRETDLLLKDWGHVLQFGDPYYNVNLTKVKEDFSINIE